MADALVERRPPARFFCHRCNVEFEDVLQDYTCPYCASGFIEQLEEQEAGLGSGDEFSDADMSNLDDMTTIDEMSNLDDSDDMPQSTPPMLNDLAFLMSGGRVRGAGRRETLMEQLVWMIGGARAGAVAAGAPFVLVGAPGDYVFGGEGLDAVVTQLLGQLENAGPPPLPREQIAALPSSPITAEQIADTATCSVCWEAFQIGEMISRLECDHIFHSTCIAPWLQLHATCPICRRSLLPDQPAAPAVTAPLESSPSRDADRDSSSTNSDAQTGGEGGEGVSCAVGRRAAVTVARAETGAGSAGWETVSSSSAMELGSSSLESPRSLASTNSHTSTEHSNSRSPHTSSSSTSLPSSTQEHKYNMDIDFD